MTIESQLREFYVNKLNFAQVKETEISDLTYDQILNKVAGGMDEYGSYDDSQDEDGWGESSDEGGTSPKRGQ